MNYFFGFNIDENNQEELNYVHAIDEELDAYSWKNLWDSGRSDTALWAATAYAGGIYQGKPDIIKRREFWTWWVHEAIPTAWQAAQ